MKIHQPLLETHTKHFVLSSQCLYLKQKLLKQFFLSITKPVAEQRKISNPQKVLQNWHIWVSKNTWSTSELYYPELREKEFFVEK